VFNLCPSVAKPEVTYHLPFFMTWPSFGPQAGVQSNYVAKTSRRFGPGIVLRGNWPICHHDRLYRLHVLRSDGDWFKMARRRPAFFDPGGCRLPVPGGGAVAGDPITRTGGRRQINRRGPMLLCHRHDSYVCDVARVFLCFRQPMRWNYGGRSITFALPSQSLERNFKSI
jgi:hypothetical protein